MTVVSDGDQVLGDSRLRHLNAEFHPLPMNAWSAARNVLAKAPVGWTHALARMAKMEILVQTGRAEDRRRTKAARARSPVPNSNMLVGSGVIGVPIDSCPLFAVAAQSGALAVPPLRNPTIEEPFGKMKLPSNKTGVAVVALGLRRVLAPRSALYT